MWKKWIMSGFNLISHQSGHWSKINILLNSIYSSGCRIHNHNQVKKSVSNVDVQLLVVNTFMCLISKYLLSKVWSEQLLDNSSQDNDICNLSGGEVCTWWWSGFRAGIVIPRGAVTWAAASTPPGSLRNRHFGWGRFGHWHRLHFFLSFDCGPLMTWEEKNETYQKVQVSIYLNPSICIKSYELSVQQRQKRKLLDM